MDYYELRVLNSAEEWGKNFEEYGKTDRKAGRLFGIILDGIITRATFKSAGIEKQIP